jgi:hypothetical protein
MSRSARIIGPLGRSLRSARTGILAMAATYAASVGVGAAMVHAGSRFAVAKRDAIVDRALRSDPASRADDAGDHGAAAAIDFSRNLGLAAIPDTIAGLTVVLPFGFAAYRGWVGGLVSIDEHHESRLRRARPALYYLVTLTLQLAGFTLAGGAGVHLGWSTIRGRGPMVGPAWFRLSRPAVIEVAWIYTLIVPLFALGSLWEFLWTGGR